MKKILGFLFIVIVLCSCKDLDKTNVENNSKSENKLTQSELIKPEYNQIELIAQKILDLPKLQWIYHPEFKERLPVKVLESEVINKDLDLNKFGQKVRILSMSELEKEGIKDFVVFDKIKIGKDTTHFKLSYKIEGAGCSGKLLKENGEWKVLGYSVWEN
ncbi:hypothetical protein OO013_19875 [Mangrovivirga sp. M17]|uniref:Uncharacterized protein n=1 Tax=Mangrovivirga halotolerans TaxID=2993936 RepID=A0ABT3RWV7_9BACT|nr:hypothetical protein [Mangrovivirga halotolerans]MCX2746148.1 hypothetical protein [Mangrovivirga halotolerans]